MLRKKKPEERSEQEVQIEIAASDARTSRPSLLSFCKKNWKRLAAGACVLAVGAAILVPKLRAKPAATTALDYIETSPERRNITNTLSNSGTITAADSYNVTSLVQGTVLSADFEVGDYVEQGKVLYVLDSSDASNELETAQISLEQAQRSYDEAVDAQYVRAPSAGTLVSFSVRVGDTVQAGQELAVLRDDSVMLLTLEFPAVDAASFAVGQSATITLSGTFETVQGVVESISGADQLSSSGSIMARTVTIAVTNPGSLTTAQAAAATINGVGSLSSAHFSYQREQKITASAGGTVAALCATPGSSVRANDALVQLSDSALTKQIQSASNNLRSAQLSMEKTQQQLDNYTITAPISGIIVKKNVKAGEKITTGSSTDNALCTIYDLSYLEMTLNIDELDILSVAEGQNAVITVDAVSDKTFSGVVTSVLVTGTTTAGTTTYPVTVRIDDTGELMPGMNATADITVANAENALSIPNAALVRGSYVLVTKDSPSAANAVSDMTAPEGYVYVKVETGVSDNDYIEVTSGLEETDTIAYSASAATATRGGESFAMAIGPGGPGGGF